MTVHIVGGGLSGLAAAVVLADSGVPVVVYEAAAQTGGRCRSYHDKELDRVIDNGNHLVLSGNANVQNYLRIISAQDRLIGPAGDGFKFVDLSRHRQFFVRPNAGPLPWWVASPSRRVPDTHLWQYVSVLRLAMARQGASVADVLRHDELYRVLWEPLAVSALNTPAEHASARAFWRVLEKTLARGGEFARPLIARDNLANTFVTPAEEFLVAHGGSIRLGTRVKRIDFTEDAVDGLATDQGCETWKEGDQLILATPPAIAERLVPRLEAPGADEPIVNAHFATHDPAGYPIDVAAVVGGAAQWVFRRPGLTSVTVSAARAMADQSAEEIAARLWQDVSAIFPDLGNLLPPCRIIKERRATIRQSPTDEVLRPETTTAYRNLWLAGDWTLTGLPATIEGSLLSGFRAAQLALRAGAQ